MQRLILALMMLVLLPGLSQAKPRHHHYSKHNYSNYNKYYKVHYAHRRIKQNIIYVINDDRYPNNPVQSNSSWAFNSNQMAFPSQGANGRPSDCYGIPWCGCWLRHVFHLPASSGLNLAANWLRFKSTAPEDANVVVWPNRHHVGLVLRVENGRALVRSGNSGRGGVTVRWVPTHGGFAFRRV